MQTAAAPLRHVLLNKNPRVLLLAVDKLGMTAKKGQAFKYQAVVKRTCLLYYNFFLQQLKANHKIFNFRTEHSFKILNLRCEKLRQISFQNIFFYVLQTDFAI
jgi:hypothetical protein